LLGDGAGGSWFEFRLRRLFAGIVEAAVVPMTVRTENAGQLARFSGRPIEVSGDVMAGIAGEIDLLDGVAVALDLAVNDGLEGSFLGHGPQAVGDQKLLAHLLPA